MARMGETVSERAVQEVAEEANCEEVELPALYEVVDPDALNALIDGMSDGEVSFRYAGHEVAIDCNEGVRVREQLTSRSAPEAARSGD